jgi:SnoaL-like domain
MSEEYIDTFKRGVEAWNAGDFDAWIDGFDPEIEWFALMEVYRGHLGLRQAWESFKGDMELTIRIDEFRDLGEESVLALGVIETTGHTTQLNFTGEIAQLVTYSQGKAILSRDFPSHTEGLKAAGLSP